MGIFRRRRDTKSSTARRTEFSGFGDAGLMEAKLNDDAREYSDVFVAPQKPKAAKPERPATADVEAVTLFVFGWHVVEPGPLSWAFPSLRAALDAVRTMRNAAQWCIVRGQWPTLEAARADGAVLIEQLV